MSDPKKTTQYQYLPQVLEALHQVNNKPQLIQFVGSPSHPIELQWDEFVDDLLEEMIIIIDGAKLCPVEVDSDIYGLKKVSQKHGHF